MGPIGKTIADLRKQKEMSQAALAKEIGVSQATISRLEALEDEVGDIRLLSKVARALGERLDTFLPEDVLRGGDVFVAFCPNPHCESNKLEMDEDGNPSLTWESWNKYPSDQFNEYNYCPDCGTELVKECPNCKRRFETMKPRYCFTCGEEICKRPTEKQWDDIRLAMTKTRERGSSGDDIPF